jgi:hypothetical protein
MKLIAALFILTIAITGCGAQHSLNPGEDLLSVQASAASLQAFQTTVYTFGQQQGCVTCHSSRVNPQWMNGDIRAAYAFARPFLDPNDPASSAFASYAANGHCGDPICMNAANVSLMRDQLQAWANVELDEANNTGLPPAPGLTLANPPYVTATMPIPANLPLLTANQPAVIRFDLSQLTPAVPALAGAILEISIRSYNIAMSTYKIYNPRIVGDSSPVRLTGLHIYVRPAAGSGLGTEDVAQGLEWSQITVQSMMTPIPIPLPAGPMSSVTPLTSRILGVGAQSGADVITLGFAQIQ